MFPFYFTGKFDKSLPKYAENRTSGGPEVLGV